MANSAIADYCWQDITTSCWHMYLSTRSVQMNFENAAGEVTYLLGHQTECTNKRSVAIALYNSLVRLVAIRSLY